MSLEIQLCASGFESRAEGNAGSQIYDRQRDRRFFRLANSSSFCRIGYGHQEYLHYLCLEWEYQSQTECLTVDLNLYGNR